LKSAAVRVVPGTAGGVAAMFNKVKRLVVVDDDGRLGGLDARREMLKLLAGDRL
jgi:predicted transcriptional regulator